MALELTVTEESVAEPEAASASSVAKIAEGGKLDVVAESTEKTIEIDDVLHRISRLYLVRSRAKRVSKRHHSSMISADKLYAECETDIEKLTEELDLLIGDDNAKAAEPSGDEGVTESEENHDYETLLRSASLADLRLSRDGKKVSLKGSVQKLADVGVTTIWDWEQLRNRVLCDVTGNTDFPKRLRKNDLEDAVSQWIGENWDKASDNNPEVPPHLYHQLKEEDDGEEQPAGVTIDDI